MVKKFCITFTLIALLGLMINAKATTTQEPNKESSNSQNTVKPVQENIDYVLENIVDGKVDIGEVVSCVKQVGKTKDKKYIPALREITEVYSKKQSIVSFFALYNLREIGESEDYFLAKAKNYKLDKRLAYYAITILAYDPTEVIVNTLKPISEDIKLEEYSPDKVSIQNAIRRVDYVYYYAKKLEEIKNFKTRVEFVLDIVGSGCGSRLNFESKPNYGPNTDPLGVWSRQKLYLFSKANAELVAEEIIKRDIAQNPGVHWVIPCPDKEYSNKDYRNYISKFLSDEAALLLAELAKQENPTK